MKVSSSPYLTSNLGCATTPIIPQQSVVLFMLLCWSQVIPTKAAVATKTALPTSPAQEALLLYSLPHSDDDVRVALVVVCRTKPVIEGEIPWRRHSRLANCLVAPAVTLMMSMRDGKCQCSRTTALCGDTRSEPPRVTIIWTRPRVPKPIQASSGYPKQEEEERLIASVSLHDGSGLLKIGTPHVPKKDRWRQIFSLFFSSLERL